VINVFGLGWNIEISLFRLLTRDSGRKCLFPPHSHPFPPIREHHGVGSDNDIHTSLPYLGLER